MMASPKSIRFTERAELLDFLLEVAAATSETLDLDRLLANVADIVKDVMPYQLFAILLYSEKLKGLRIRYSIGHREEVIRNLVVGLGEGITGAAAAAREPILVKDVRSDTRYIAGLDAVRSELAVPMIARGKLVGVIDVQSTRADSYSEYDRTLLKLIGSRVAVSIDNARLYRRVEQNHKLLRSLRDISHEFSAILDLDELLRKIAEIIRVLINYDAFSVLLVDEEKRVLRHRFSVRYNEPVQPDNIPLGKGVTGASAELRQPVRVNDTSLDVRYIAAHPHIRSEVAVPLIVHDRVMGVLDLESSRIGYFTEEHVRTLTLLAPQIAASVENARLYQELAQREKRMQDDLTAASRLQSILLPKQAPNIEGLEIGIGARPARDITGDIFDFFEYGTEHAGICFGDSSGKGAAAALYGALVSGLMRSLATERQGPALLMKSLNEALLERRVDAQYVTLLVILWHAHSRVLNMANAGSLPPLVIRGDKVIKPRVEGVPLGLLDDREYEEVSFQAESGDVIVLYSDGIPDATDLAGNEYTRRRLASVVLKAAAEPAQKIVEAIFQDLDTFTEGVGMADDETLVILKVS